MAAMAEACARLPQDAPTLPRLQLKIYAIAVRDEDVRRLGAVRWARLWRVISALSGEPPEEITRFLATGLLINVQAAFGAPTGPDLPHATAEWAKNLRSAEPDHPQPPAASRPPSMAERRAGRLCRPMDVCGAGSHRPLCRSGTPTARMLARGRRPPTAPPARR